MEALKQRFRCVVPLMLSVTAVLSPSGCAVGAVAFPFVDVAYYETEDQTGRAVQLRAWGLCILTNPADAGVVLGATNRTYYFEGTKSAGGSIVLPDLRHSQTHRLRLVEEEFDWRSLRPAAHGGQSIGVMIHANSIRIGATIGLNTYAALRLPRDFDGLLLIDALIGKPSLGELYIRREKSE